ncbi:cysteine/histidine-rich C1 domain protein [Rhynchospora pubera]|uniref:Cysteine/histidine-rich C1 domain protein n=1 Tax=Rhynchospora pubera TaxID=906938 RepID=A0AAV8GAX7_9POAL|nr:cysteine/histidine-rich C1 domain protein [Rhynchospora pubera]
MASLITHCSHPAHRLVRTYSPSGQYTCDLCRAWGSGLHYRCDACDFDLHEHCAEFPETISFFAHPWHNLHLKRGTGSRICDLCREPVEGFYYCCISCNFDVHPHCTKTQQIVRTKLHPEHSLCLVPSYNNCCACGCFNGHIWLYRCGMCNIDLHIRCVGHIMSIEHNHDSGTSSNDNNRSSYGEVMAAADVLTQLDLTTPTREIQIIQSQLELLQEENIKLKEDRDNAVKGEVLQKQEIKNNSKSTTFATRRK